MIEDKKLGLVIAENDNEKAWFGVVEGIKHEIKMLNLRIKKDQENLRMPERKVINKFREGAKASIKQCKEAINIQKEILKLAKSKISVKK